MDQSKYNLIPDEHVESCDGDACHEHHSSRGKRSGRRTLILIIALIAAIFLNVFLLWKLSFPVPVGSVSRSLYAGLLNDLDVPYTWNTKFSGDNYTEVNKLWYEDSEADKGVIAIDRSFAEQMGLPPSQSFPWDEKKKFYVTNGHHALHCLRAIYMSLDQFRFQTPQTWTWPHVLHCMDTLRSDILCSADDTLRWTGDTGLFLGEGQNRKCRDWGKLNEWVEKHPGCFRFIEEGNEELANAERVKYCANDSLYVPVIRKFFGFGEEWVPWPSKG